MGMYVCVCVCCVYVVCIIQRGQKMVLCTVIWVGCLCVRVTFRCVGTFMCLGWLYWSGVGGCRVNFAVTCRSLYRCIDILCIVTFEEPFLSK